MDLYEVEQKKLGEVLEYEQPSSYIVESTEYSNNFRTPVLTAGQTFILGYTNEIQGIFHADKKAPVIIFDDFTTSNKWVDFDFKVKSSAMKILKSKGDVVTLRYCYYYMQIIKCDTTEHKRMWISKYSQIKIPIPPLYVQSHVTSILDKFERLVNSIEEGIPAEIALRKKQYEYYRQKLLTFDKGD